MRCTSVPEGSCKTSWLARLGRSKSSWQGPVLRSAVSTRKPPGSTNETWLSGITELEAIRLQPDKEAGRQSGLCNSIQGDPREGSIWSSLIVSAVDSSAATTGWLAVPGVGFASTHSPVAFRASEYWAT